MLTPHEAACEHLKTLDRAEHPEIEELLAVVRQHPVEIQRACEDAVKRGEDAAVLAPIRAIADRQAVELQELLDALTTAPAGTADDAWLESKSQTRHFTPDAVPGTFGGAPITQGDPAPWPKPLDPSIASSAELAAQGQPLEGIPAFGVEATAAVLAATSGLSPAPNDHSADL